MKITLPLVVFCLQSDLIASGAARGGTTTTLPIIDHESTFSNVQSVNTTDSLNVIQRLNLQTFEYAFDTIEGRTLVGVLGPELRQVLPGSCQILPETLSLYQRQTGERVLVSNFHHIDRDAIYMHNVGATQALIDQSLMQARDVAELSHAWHRMSEKVESFESALTAETAKALMVKREMAELENQRLVLASELEITTTKERAQEMKYRQQVEEEIEQTREQFATKRLEREERTKKERHVEMLEMQEQSQVRLELLRLETEATLLTQRLEAERQTASLEANTTLERARLDIEGRIKQQRENQDIELSQLRETNEAEQQKVLKSIQMIFDNLGSGFVSLVTDSEKLRRFILACVILAAGIYVTKEAIRLGGHVLEQYLGKPSLVRETSRGGGGFSYLRSLLYSIPELGLEELNDVVLSKDLSNRIIEVTRSTKNSKKHAAPYRHLLLYGPPGTGKTMVAKRLAKCSGLDYAIMSGGDVGPLGKDAVTELHAIFRWAKASPRGVLLFIDEAEAFLGCRAKHADRMSESMRNALNALLYQTGEQSQKFMMVIATNRPEDLDMAVTDRIDETLHFDLPEFNQRRMMMEMYYHDYILQAHVPVGQRRPWTRREPMGSPTASSPTGMTASPSTGKARSGAAVGPTPGSSASSTLGSSATYKKYVQRLLRRSGGDDDTHSIEIAPDMTLDAIADAAKSAKGMSGREISKLMLYLQSTIYGQDERRLTAKLFRRVVADKILEHERKADLRQNHD